MKDSGGQLTQDVLSRCSEILGLKVELMKIYDKEVLFLFLFCKFILDIKTEFT